MSTSIEDKILDAVDTLIQQKTSSLNFDRTIKATVVKVVDEATGEYRVQKQESVFTAFSQEIETKYKERDSVYVRVTQNDFSKTPIIVGKINRNDIVTVAPITIRDRLQKVGGNLCVNAEKEEGLFSYENSSIHLLQENRVKIDDFALEQYKDLAECLVVSANFKTQLPHLQSLGKGNYGIAVSCKYYDPTVKAEKRKEKTSTLINKTYFLDISEMIGQPYKYIQKSNQFACFTIDSKNLAEITSIDFFCKNFPEKIDSLKHISGRINSNVFTPEEQKEPLTRKEILNYDFFYSNGKKYLYNKLTDVFYEAQDIWVSDISLHFANVIPEEEMQGTYLKIEAPEGTHFKTKAQKELDLWGRIFIDGKEVSCNKNLFDFYWFQKDTSIKDGDPSYSIYGGAGWKCLNKPLKGIGEKEKVGETLFIPATNQTAVLQEDCPFFKNQFKMVVVFSQDGVKITRSAEITLMNQAAQKLDFVQIFSTQGKKFNFNLGSTTLICKDADGRELNSLDFTYYWGKRVDGGRLESIAENTNKISVDLLGVLEFVTYEVTIYKNKIPYRYGEITLNNLKERNSFSLILNNASQVFKYDLEGFSPTAQRVRAEERAIIPALTFDIYDDTGHILQMTDEEKIEKCDIKWVWCGNRRNSKEDDTNTMLLLSDSLNGHFEREEVYDVVQNSKFERNILKNVAYLKYRIQDKYDVEKSDNTIYLEVKFQNQILTAKSNFTFTKEGELGTNGTKYFARVIPYDEQMDNIFLLNKKFYSWKYVGKKSQVKITELNRNTNLLKCQLWGENPEPLYDSSRNSSDYSTSWSVVGEGRPNHRANLQLKDGCFIANDVVSNCSSVIQAEITDLSTKKKYYAGFPVDCVQTDSNSDIIPLIVRGYRHCVYQSDGFNSQYADRPFELLLLKKQGGLYTRIKPDKVNWSNSWSGKIFAQSMENEEKWYDAKESTNYSRVKISPPSKFIAEKLDNYIAVEASYKGRSYKNIVSIEFYLNRFGASALNEWDGTSLKLNSEGDQYILAPQIGAGEKDSNNAFTGVTMGTGFIKSNKTLQRKNGLFAFHEGAQTFFLDAKDGSCHLGKSGDSQINMSPKKWGVAPSGSLFSGNYYNYNSLGAPSQETGEGMLIDLSEPSIKFGSGNFSVDSNGNLTAKGGGSIAGWKIEDHKLYSSKNKNIFLCSDDSENNTVFNANQKFKVYNDGSFFASNGDFSVSSGGEITSTAGTIGGWKISKSFLTSSSNSGTYLSSSRGSASGEPALCVNNKFKVYGNGSFSASNSKFSVDSNGRITAKSGTIGGWSIGNNSISSGGIEFNSYNNTLRAGDSFSVDSRGKMTAKSGTIGGWNINSTSLTGGNVTLSRNGALTGPGWNISSIGNATFNNLTCNKTFKIGNVPSYRGIEPSTRALTKSNNSNFYASMTGGGSVRFGLTLKNGSQITEEGFKFKNRNGDSYFNFDGFQFKGGNNLFTPTSISWQTGSLGEGLRTGSYTGLSGSTLGSNFTAAGKGIIACNKLIANEVNARKANFNSLNVNKASVGQLNVVKNLVATKASVGQLNAAIGKLDSLYAKKAEIVELKAHVRQGDLLIDMGTGSFVSVSGLLSNLENTTSNQSNLITRLIFDQEDLEKRIKKLEKKK